MDDGKLQSFVDTFKQTDFFRISSYYMIDQGVKRYWFSSVIICSIVTIILFVLLVEKIVLATIFVVVVWLMSLLGWKYVVLKKLRGQTPTFADFFHFDSILINYFLLNIIFGTMQLGIYYLIGKILTNIIPITEVAEFDLVAFYKSAWEYISSLTPLGNTISFIALHITIFVGSFLLSLVINLILWAFYILINYWGYGIVHEKWNIFEVFSKGGSKLGNQRSELLATYYLFLFFYTLLHTLGLYWDFFASTRRPFFAFIARVVSNITIFIYFVNFTARLEFVIGLIYLQSNNELAQLDKKLLEDYYAACHHNNDEGDKQRSKFTIYPWAESWDGSR